MAQNLTRSVFTRSALPSHPPPSAVPVSSSNPQREKPVGSYEGYVSNDDEELEELERSRTVKIQKSVTRAPEMTARAIAPASKRAFISTPDEHFSAAKRPKTDEASEILKSDQSSALRRHRFWTSGTSSSRSVYRPASVCTSKPISVSIGDKVQFHQEKPVNLFSVTPRTVPSRPLSTASSTSGTASFATLSSISEINKKFAARNSETKRILLDLERVGGLPTPDSKRPRLWFQTISEEVLIPRKYEKKRTPFGPPTSSLRTTDRAQVLPTVTTPIGVVSSQRRVPNEQAPPIPAAVKRSATNETTGPNTVNETTLFGNPVLPSACKFTFSKPLPVSLSMDADKTDASIPDISNSKVVPFFGAQTTPSAAGTLQFPKITLTPSPAATSTTDSLSRPESAADITDKITFEDYKKAAKWKCKSCHFNNNPDDTSCRQCFCAKPVEQAVSEKANQAKEKIWRCSKCRLDNPESLDRCRSCQTSNTLNGTGPSSSDVKSKWSCSSCFISNESSAVECVCCKTVRPGKSAVVTSTKPKWSCSSCCVSNDDTADECICCKTAKPKKEVKSSGTESWWCGTCSLKNDSALTKCVACGSERIQQSVQPAKPEAAGSTSGAAPSSKPKWSCSTCFIGNDPSADKCVCCSTPRPSQSTAAPKSAMSGGATQTAPKSSTKPEGGEKKATNWSCTTCFLSNAGDRVKCIACQSPRPGTAFKPVPFGMKLFGVSNGAGIASNASCSSSVAKLVETVPSASKTEIQPFSMSTFAKTTKEQTASIAPSTVTIFGIDNKSSVSVVTAASTVSSAVFGINSKPSVTSETPSTFSTAITFGISKPSLETQQPIKLDAVKAAVSDNPFLQKIDRIPTITAPIVFPSFPASSSINADKTVNGSESSKAPALPSLPSFSKPTTLEKTEEAKPKLTEPAFSAVSSSNLFVFGKSANGSASSFSFLSASNPSTSEKADQTTKTTAPALFAASSTTKLFGNDKPTNGSGSTPMPSFPSIPISSSNFSFGKVGSKIAASSMFPASSAPNLFGMDKAANGGAPSPAPAFPSLPISSNADSSGKADGVSSAVAPSMFPTLSGSNLFGMDKSANGSAASPAFPSLPSSVNPFNVTTGSTPISGRKQLIAKRKKRT